MSISPIIFGSTGMIGQSVLKECLDDKNVKSILLVNRRPLGIKHNKIKEIIVPQLEDLATVKVDFENYDTCFYCLGITSVGMKEPAYHQITYDLTIQVASQLLEVKTGYTFCYISGAGTDSTEKGRVMWARVKGKTENKLLSLPFRASYMFRPGYIQPLKGIRSRTSWYNAVYTVFKPLYFILKPFKSLVTDTSSMGKAMISVALKGYSKKILENKEIN